MSSIGKKRKETSRNVNTAEGTETMQNDTTNDTEDTIEISGEELNEPVEAEVVPEQNGEGDGPSADPPAESEHLQFQLKQMKDRLLRQMAEFQNYRRRTEQEKNLWIQSGKVVVIQQMLELLDDFTRSIDAASRLEEQQVEVPPMYKTLKDGVVMVYDKFKDELGRLGVEPIEAVGQPFNEREHEALMQQPAPEDTNSGTVLEEIQKGYRLGDRVLRHSKVIVAT